MAFRACPCGSGLDSWWENDARGIPLARVCEKCQKEKLARYRPEVLSNPNYDADEDIDGDEDVGKPCAHSWVENGDEQSHGEGRTYCEYCGADGDG